jgi:ubiquinone/menaquinone biosynthesis C-methylase UbiE
VSVLDRLLRHRGRHRRTERYLTSAQTRRVYDRIGRIQDLQALYEHRATSELIAHAGFDRADAVLELGYGTGAFAERLLSRLLSPSARYVGVDVSPHMHELAARRLARFGDRAELMLGDGSLRFGFDSEAFDRVVANYVLDLLAPRDIAIFVREARRLLAPGGLLCLTSLASGASGAARLVTSAWQLLWDLRPELVGGCRPLSLTEHVGPHEWTQCYDAVVTSLGVSSEILVAAPRA